MSSDKSNLVLVINTTRIPRNVDIFKDKLKTAVHIAEQGRCYLPEGYQVSPNWLAVNPKVLKIFTPDEIKQAREAKATAGATPAPAPETNSQLEEGAE